MFAVGLAAATEGPPTADVAAEVIRQLQSQGIVMRGADQPLCTCPSDHAIPPASVQPAKSRVVDQLTGEERQHGVSSISQPIDIHVENKIKARIQANEFIEFNTLSISPAPIHQPEQYSIQIAGNSPAGRPKTKINPYPHPRAMDICLPHLRHDLHPSPPVCHLRTNEICLNNRHTSKEIALWGGHLLRHYIPQMEETPTSPRLGKYIKNDRAVHAGTNHREATVVSTNRGSTFSLSINRHPRSGPVLRIYAQRLLSKNVLPTTAPFATLATIYETPHLGKRVAQRAEEEEAKACPPTGTSESNNTSLPTPARVNVFMSYLSGYNTSVVRLLNHGFTQVSA